MKVYCVKLAVEEGNPGWTLKRTGGSAASLTAVANMAFTRALVGLGLSAQGSQGDIFTTEICTPSFGEFYALF